MTNSVTSSTSSSIRGKMDAAGSTPSITVRGSRLLDISIDAVTGSFVGTVNLERSTYTGAANIPAWQIVESYTTATEKVAQSANTREYRLTTIAGMSGYILYDLTAGNFV